MIRRISVGDALAHGCEAPGRPHVRAPVRGRQRPCGRANVPTPTLSGKMEYGGRRGIWNILELLDKLGHQGDVLRDGMTAEKFPDTVRAAHEAGHEIAGMGYSFEKVRTVSREREQAIVRRSVKRWPTPVARRSRAGAAPTIASARRPSMCCRPKASAGTAACSTTICRICWTARRDR